MEIIKEKLRQNELQYWNKKFSEAYPNIRVIPIMDLDEIEHHNLKIDYFRKRHPFFEEILKIVSNETITSNLQAKVVNEIITYLTDVYENGNILVDRGNYQTPTKKLYSKEKRKILTDLKLIIYHSILDKKIRNVDKAISTSETSLPTLLINDEKKFKSILGDLQSNKILDNNFNWIGMGPGYSKTPTQVAVFLTLLLNKKIIQVPKKGQRLLVEHFARFFCVDLTPSRYSQVKKELEDLKGISNKMMHYSIYKKLNSHIKI